MNMEKEGGPVNRPPILDGSNYEYWKARMVAFLKSLDSRTWKAVIKGRGHNKDLHISVKCMDHIVAKVIIDKIYSLNVMPKMTLDKLPFDVSYMRPSSMVIRAFDGSHHDVRGEIDLPIQIGPYMC